MRHRLCREYPAIVARRFTARRMAEDYVDVYESLMAPAPRLQVVNA